VGATFKHSFWVVQRSNWSGGYMYRNQFRSDRLNDHATTARRPGRGSGSSTHWVVSGGRGSTAPAARPRSPPYRRWDACLLFIHRDGAYIDCYDVYIFVVPIAYLHLFAAGGPGACSSSTGRGRRRVRQPRGMPLAAVLLVGVLPLLSIRDQWTKVQMLVLCELP